MEHIKVEEQVSMTLDDHEILVPDSETDEPTSTFDGFGSFTRNGMINLDEGNGEHDIIKKSFLLGMGDFGKDANVVAIHKNSYSSLAGQARLESFRIFSEAVAKKCGGDANIKYAWYGGSREEIRQIIAHGFSRCGRPTSSEFYGFGVYLSPAKFSIDGALSSNIDETGLRHVLLCRVILGNMEVVSAGSKQCTPSSKQFDSGVDNLSEPRRYVVWGAYMNSHIFPNYIVSFRAPCFQGHPRMQANMVKPTSPWMRFPTLMYALTKFLPHSKMVLIVRYHNDYREKQDYAASTDTKIEANSWRQVVDSSNQILSKQGTRDKNWSVFSSWRCKMCEEGYAAADT
ncbi:hypothetical protein L1049_006056 [Liquidambar formosana]|uniref:Poly [ADP-ribose] polymerase n=1 Tax=Liquidambar formosana TaxID=63359 RepID=A0AAP0REW4_LIQFO